MPYICMIATVADSDPNTPRLDGWSNAGFEAKTIVAGFDPDPGDPFAAGLVKCNATGNWEDPPTHHACNWMVSSQDAVDAFTGSPEFIIAAENPNQGNPAAGMAAFLAGHELAIIVWPEE